MRSPWDRLMAVSTYGPLGSEEDDEPDSGWDFSGLGDSSAMRDFMTACDYCLSDCSDSSHSLGDEDYGPSCECFHVDLGGLDEGNHLGMLEDGDPPRPAPRIDILRELAVVPVPAGDQDAQLEQIREMQARLDEEAGQLVQLRQNIGQEWAGRAPAGEARHLSQDVQHCIADDARARLPPASSGVGQNLAAAAILLRAMPEPSTIEGRRIQGELKNLLEDAAVRRTESSASRRPGYPGASRRDFSIHTGSLSPHRAHAEHSAGGLGTPRQRAPPRPSSPPRGEGAPRLPPQAWGTLQQRGGSEPLARTTRSASFQPGHTTGAVPDPVLNPDYHHQVLGESKPKLWLADYRLACQLGVTDDDNLIIRNLPLFLSDAARAWLEHLPPAQISNWDDLVKAFVGNLQGTYVRPRNSWDLRSCRQQPGESLRDYIRRFLKQRTELPNITDSDVIGAFLSGTTCRNLVSKLGRKTPTRASELMDITTKFASG
jgi:hypothetical protein